MDNIKLTIDEIHSYNGLENLTDTEVQQLADFLAIYAISTYNTLKNKKLNTNINKDEYN